jgi:hypothetical protein
LLRKLVGIIALALPFALAGGSIAVGLLGPEHDLPHPLLQRSISDYYYTPVGDLFEGSLWVIAFFLVCSRGYDRHDVISGYLAGFFTLGVALFPSFNPRLARYTHFQIRMGYVHTAFAALMFLSVAYFCLFLFRRSAQDRRKTRRKRMRNRIYGTCGVVILACMVTMVSLTLKGIADWLRPLYPLLCCESLALFAFGVAWLTKGEGLLRDLPHERVVRHLEVVER